MYNESYKAPNSVFQGSAADIMKAGMVLAYEAGVYDNNRMKLHITVHDETVKSVLPTKEGMESLKEEKYIMENSIELFTDGALGLKVPLIFEQEIGSNWCDTKEVDFEK